MASLCLHSVFKLSSFVSVHAPPSDEDQPSRVRSTPRFLPGPCKPLTRTSTTNSVADPEPSPPLPKTRRSHSWSRSLTGRKTPQNLASEDAGGGGVRYSLARYVTRTAGRASKHMREGENVGCINSGASLHVCNPCRIKRDGSVSFVSVELTER
jgi:hypothetical protein